MMKRRLLITSMLLTLVLGIAAHAGNWVGSAETGWRYQNDDGSYVTAAWFQDTDGAWYYFGPDALMQHDTWIDGLYYVDSSGKMMTNAVTPDGYQVGPDGKWIQGAASQPETVSFGEILDLFRTSFAESGNEAIQFVNVYGENDNTVVLTANITGDPDTAGFETLYIALAKAVFEETFPEILQATGEAYGQRVYLKVNYAVNGQVYDTVTY